MAYQIECQRPYENERHVEGDEYLEVIDDSGDHVDDVGQLVEQPHEEEHLHQRHQDACHHHYLPFNCLLYGSKLQIDVKVSNHYKQQVDVVHLFRKVAYLSFAQLGHFDVEVVLQKNSVHYQDSLVKVGVLALFH